jgi:choline dehydrogenase-like flavoprotein
VVARVADVVIVVGAGSLSARLPGMLAARLSEDPSLGVVLLEAGPDYPDVAALPEELVVGWRLVFELPPWRELNNDEDQAALERALRAGVGTYHHPVGTWRMGADPESGAVVDAACRTHGVDQLMVVDASVMPEIPAANTNIPTIMVAEQVSAQLVPARASSRGIE